MPLINNLYFKFRHFFANSFPKLYSFCDKRKAVVKFLIAGCIAGGSDLILLFIFHGLFKWGLVISTSVAFILSFVVSFNLQKFWTFRNYSQKKIAGQFILYLLNAFVGLNLNGWFMHLLVNKWNIWYILAQFVVNLTIGFYNFLIYKFIVFSTHDDEINSGQKSTGDGAGNMA